MITYLSTSIFDSPAMALVNPVNTVGVMGKGLALEFKRRYPKMFGVYYAMCFTGTFRIGDLFIYTENGKMIVNFPTKKHWRYPSRIEYIEAGLVQFAREYKQDGITSVAFPKLGCGYGGLNWQDVKVLMEAALSHCDIPVYIHRCSKES